MSEGVHVFATGPAGGVAWRLPYRPDCRDYYAALRDRPWPVWLDSGYPHAAGDRHYDIITADPYLTLVHDDGVTTVSPVETTAYVARGDPLAILRGLLGDPRPSLPGLAFPGGAIGFMGYDFARDTGLLQPRDGLRGWPEMAIGLYDWALVVDHDRQRSYFVRQGRDPRGDASWRDALGRLKEVTAAPTPSALSAKGCDAAMDYADYARAFDRIQQYIRDGDCYQVNFAQRFHAVTDDDAWTLYQHMRASNPAPYGALLEYPFGQVLSSSPEQFVRMRDGDVTTRPIKGTRPRVADVDDDARMRAELVRSEKDRAENVMIVDLLRNDLGRVCKPGSISVPRLFQIESFATVHHLVSTVTGTLADGRDAIDLLSATFPGGSITGAPKRRAMEIIDELEPVRREVYCGNVIRLGFDGALDSSITIRTALLQGRDLYYWAGGGIVADSQCDAEYAESLDKAAAFLRLVGQPLASFQRS